MAQSNPFHYYRRLAVQIRDNFKPPQALEGMNRLQRRAENDDGLGLEDKIEVYKLIDMYKKKLRRD